MYVSLKIPRYQEIYVFDRLNRLYTGRFINRLRRSINKQAQWVRYLQPKLIHLINVLYGLTRL